MDFNTGLPFGLFRFSNTNSPVNFCRGPDDFCGGPAPVGPTLVTGSHPLFPGTARWPHCPASRPRPSRDAKCPVFRPWTKWYWNSAADDTIQDRNVLASKLKLGKLILRKTINIVATRCHILKLKCIKFDFGWGFAPDPAEGAYRAPPGPLAGFKHPSKGGEEKEGVLEGRPVFSVQLVGNPTFRDNIYGPLDGRMVIGLLQLCRWKFLHKETL